MMTIVERVAARHLANEHERLLKEFTKLFVKGLSDRKLIQQLGITMDQAHGLVAELRRMHGVSTLVNLREYLRGLQ
jgi:hypothetical protein